MSDSMKCNGNPNPTPSRCKALHTICYEAHPDAKGVPPMKRWNSFLPNDLDLVKQSSPFIGTIQNSRDRSPAQSVTPALSQGLAWHDLLERPLGMYTGQLPYISYYIRENTLPLLCQRQSRVATHYNRIHRIEKNERPQAGFSQRV